VRSLQLHMVKISATLYSIGWAQGPCVAPTGTNLAEASAILRRQAWMLPSQFLLLIRARGSGPSIMPEPSSIPHNGDVYEPADRTATPLSAPRPHPSCLATCNLATRNLAACNTTAYNLATRNLATCTQPCDSGTIDEKHHLRPASTSNL
jgi:hypothetical protein